jgi:hypothetical protein
MGYYATGAVVLGGAGLALEPRTRSPASATSDRLGPRSAGPPIRHHPLRRVDRPRPDLSVVHGELPPGRAESSSTPAPRPSTRLVPRLLTGARSLWRCQWHQLWLRAGASALPQHHPRLAGPKSNLRRPAGSRHHQARREVRRDSWRWFNGKTVRCPAISWCKKTALLRIEGPISSSEECRRRPGCPKPAARPLFHARTAGGDRPGAGSRRSSRTST